MAPTPRSQLKAASLAPRAAKASGARLAGAGMGRGPGPSLRVTRRSRPLDDRPHFLPNWTHATPRIKSYHRGCSDCSRVPACPPPVVFAPGPHPGSPTLSPFLISQVSSNPWPSLHLRSSFRPGIGVGGSFLAWAFGSTLAGGCMEVPSFAFAVVRS